MCKVLMIAGIKPQHIPKVHKLAKAASKNMSLIEDDGVGYAAITNEGNVYGEKWRNKEDAFVIHSQPADDPVISFMDKTLGDMAEWTKAPSTMKVYDSFGERSSGAIDNTVALILHARKATGNSDKNIQNVHPFRLVDIEDQPDTALIHNGSIVNHEKLTKTMSTCDSEVILHEYIANMTYHNPWGIEQIAKTLIGGYVVGVLSSMLDTDLTWRPVLDIFKSDSNKDLHAGYVPELETLVFCTSATVLEDSCKEVGMTVKNIVKIKEGFFLRLDALTGERLEDLISFAPSAKWDNTYTNPHQNSMVRHGPASQVITSVTKSELEVAKTGFERKHPSLFTMPYAEVHEKLEANETALFSELSKDQETNHKALHLVAIALAAVQSRA